MAIISDYEEAQNDQTLVDKQQTLKTDQISEEKLVKNDQEKQTLKTDQTSEEKLVKNDQKSVPDQEDKEENNLLVPNEGNGLDMEDHSWTQTLDELTVTVQVPPGTKARQVVCEIKKKSLKVGLKGQEKLILDGELYETVKVDDCFWNIEDNKLVSVLMTKCDKLNWWKSLFKGGPEINTQKVEPGTSKLSDLDPETRATVEKMMFDQRQKEMGLPTSKEIQNQDIMKQFMAQNPNMDFSNMKMMG